MKKNLFDNYTANIKNIISGNYGMGAMNEQYSNLSGIQNFEKAQSSIEMLEPSTALKDLAYLLGIKEIKKPVKGDHPDFKNLRTKKGVEMHYIVSMFIDVKNSTKLHYNYDLNQITLILQTIIAAATQTCALFGGHIQRIQGDGVFVYFGGKGINKIQAMEEAVNAASFFTYFVKYELRELFEMEDINRIFTRIGIDFGDDPDVMWAIFGLPGCDELTTNSLHTSLPAKMQSYAPSNGILLGQNICEKLSDIDSYSDFLRDERGNIDSQKQYIFKKPDGSFKYYQKSFKWDSYLKNSFPFVKSDEQGKLYIDDSIDPAQEAERLRRLEVLKSVGEMSKTNILLNSRKPIPVPLHGFHFKDGN